MGRVEWTRLSGDGVEAVVAMLLCTEYPNAWRVRPGQGDGGVDVFVPLSDDRKLRDVYQVKKFAENLTSSQKRQIKASFNKVLKTADDKQWKISSWFPCDASRSHAGERGVVRQDDGSCQFSVPLGGSEPP